MTELGTFQISPSESEQFAQASGDFNPLHLDAIAARRTQFGSTLIHGVFGTLRALDLLLEQTLQQQSLARLKVKYTRPVPQGRLITVTKSTDADSIRLELSAGGNRCQIIDLQFAAAQLDEEKFTPDTNAPSATCKILSIDDCSQLASAVPLRSHPDIIASLAPHAARLLPAAQIATILASTEIVGMRCPGLHSVFAQLHLTFGETESVEYGQLLFKVTNADSRFDRVEIAVDNAYASGTIEAFFRPPPAQQATFEDALNCVPADEFQGQKALVIGASRGLGEVIAKVLAAGGAQLMLTYAAGQEDAENVAASIASARNRPKICQYDILAAESPPQVLAFAQDATHIYYLASPLIEKGEAEQFNDALFARYSDYYVGGLATLINALAKRRDGNQPLDLFIPSSVFLDGNTKGFSEYIAAKLAAEEYAETLPSSLPGCRVSSPRLPRLLTDQTSGVRGISQTETLDVIRSMLSEHFGSSAKTDEPQPAGD